MMVAFAQPASVPLLVGLKAQGAIESWVDLLRRDQGRQEE